MTIKTFDEEDVLQFLSLNDSGEVDDYKLAYDQSHGFFDDIPTNKWRIHQEIVSHYQPHKNPDDPLEFVPGHSKRKAKYFNSPRAFYQTNYEPNFTCEFERRVGGNGNGDGPKWVRMIASER